MSPGGANLDARDWMLRTSLLVIEEAVEGMTRSEAIKKPRQGKGRRSGESRTLQRCVQRMVVDGGRGEEKEDR